MAGVGLEVEDLSVIFGRKPALEVSRLDIAPGALVALTGPSGSGKTTLLHALAGILKPSKGAVRWGGTDIAQLREPARDAWRRQTVGLVFQDFHLLDQLGPAGNVLLPATFAHLVIPNSLRKRAGELLVQFGVPAERRYVTQLSRGERQRVAIARALLFNPPILLADEPTASLDQEAAEQVAEQLVATAGQGRTTLVVSHDTTVIERCQRVIRLERGRIVSDETRLSRAPGPLAGAHA